jgi:hypothetical protein
VRLIGFIEWAAVIIGIIGIIAGEFFALPNGFQLGVFMAGAGIALGGIEALATHRMCFSLTEDAHYAYAGAPALLVGAMALLVGTGIILSAYLLADGQWPATVSYLTRRPAPVLIAAGLLLVGIGALMMLNPRGRRGVAWTLLVRVPRWLLGLVLVAGGVAGIGLGAWEWLEPAAFDRFVKELEPEYRRFRLRFF